MDRQTPFEVVTTTEQDTCVVWPVGELDMGTAPLLAATLAGVIDATEYAEVVVDLRDLRFVDAGGLRVLVEAYWRAVGRSRPLRARNARGEVDTVLWLTGVADLLGVPTLRRALGGTGSRPGAAHVHGSATRGRGRG